MSLTVSHQMPYVPKMEESVSRSQSQFEKTPKDRSSLINCVAITALVLALIISVGLMIAGIVTGALGLLPLHCFIPMIVMGAVGVVASSILMKFCT